MNTRYELGEKIKLRRSGNRFLGITSRVTAFAAAVVISSSLLTGNMQLFTSKDTKPVSSDQENGSGLTILAPGAESRITGQTSLVAKLAHRPVGSYDMFWYIDNGSWNWMSNNADGTAKQADISVAGWNWRAPDDRYTITLVAVMHRDGQRIYSGLPIHVGGPQPSAAGAGTSSQPPRKEAAPLTGSGSTVNSPTATVPTPVPPAVPATPVNTPIASGNTINNVIAAPTGDLYVNPNSNAARTAATSNDPTTKRIMSRLAATPSAVWFGGWNSNVQSDVNALVSAASATGKLPVLVAYNIPERDCGQYSAGGADSAASYRAWIDGFAAGISGRKALVILEPDALGLLHCLSQENRQARYDMLSYATRTLQAAGASTYIEASTWISVPDMAAHLQRAGIAGATGFSLNVSGFNRTSDMINYGKQLSALVGNKHFVIDTSRNGQGSNGEWCNPAGRSLGEAPTARTGQPLVDYLLWMKTPGESDGNCNGGPSAGVWWPAYAQDLALKAGW